MYIMKIYNGLDALEWGNSEVAVKVISDIEEKLQDTERLLAIQKQYSNRLYCNRICEWFGRTFTTDSNFWKDLYETSPKNEVINYGSDSWSMAICL